jgi:hypothetical protein
MLVDHEAAAHMDPAGVQVLGAHHRRLEPCAGADPVLASPCSQFDTGAHGSRVRGTPGPRS